MKKSPEIFEKIEGYLNNRLSHEQRIAFEKEMDTDPELKQEFEKHASVHKTLGNKDTLAFKEKLIKIGNRITEQEKSSSTTSFNSFWKIAASIIILFGMGTILFYTLNNHNEAEGLYAKFYEPFLVEDTTRGEGKNDLQNVLQNYTLGKYDKVTEPLENEIKTNNQTELKIYLGNSYLNLNEDKKAVEIFENIQKENPYFEVAQWYLSLSYLKLKKRKEAISILDSVIKYNGVYKTSASLLKKELEK